MHDVCRSCRCKFSADTCACFGPCQQCAVCKADPSLMRFSLKNREGKGGCAVSACSDTCSKAAFVSHSVGRGSRAASLALSLLHHRSVSPACQGLLRLYPGRTYRDLSPSVGSEESHSSERDGDHAGRAGLHSRPDPFHPDPACSTTPCRAMRAARCSHWQLRGPVAPWGGGAEEARGPRRQPRLRSVQLRH